MTYRYLKDWREFLDTTQDAVAEAVGVQQSAYAKWERGEVSPQLDKLERLADFYRVPLVDLFAPPPAPGTRNLWPRARAILSSLPPEAAEHWVQSGEVMRDLWAAPAGSSGPAPPGPTVRESRPLLAGETPAPSLEPPAPPHSKRRKHTLHEPAPPPFNSGR